MATASGWSVSSPLSSMILGLNLAFFGDQPQKVNFSHFEEELLVLLRLVPTLELELFWTPLFSLAGDKDVEDERRLLGGDGLDRAMMEAVAVEIMDSTSISWFSLHFLVPTPVNSLYCKKWRRIFAFGCFWGANKVRRTHSTTIVTMMITQQLKKSATAAAAASKAPASSIRSHSLAPQLWRWRWAKCRKARLCCYGLDLSAL